MRALGGILILALAVHASYIANGFVWLDHGDLGAGRAVLPLERLGDAFLAPFGETGFYRPWVTVANSVDRALWGDWAPGYHLTNVLLHLAVTAAAFFFARVFFELDRRGAALAALVVGVHPLSWLPVGALAYRPELMVTLFVLLALSFHVRVRRGLGPAWPVFLCLVGALFSKETALPWLLAGALIWEATRSAPAVEAQRQGAYLAGLVATAAVYFGLRWHAVGAGWHLSAPEMTVSEWLGTRLAVLGRRFLELVAPVEPPLSDATEVVGLARPEALAPLLVLVCGLLLLPRLQPVPARLLLFVAAALAPAANLLALPRFSSPHYGYFAVVGVGAAAALLHGRFRGRRRAAAGAVLALWLAAMAVSTFLAGFRFRDDRTLFTPEVARDPHFREGHFYLGYAGSLPGGDLEAAARAYAAALPEDPRILAYVDLPALYLNYAGVRARQQRWLEAERLLVSAEAVAPRRMRFLIVYRRALVAQQVGDYQKVVHLLGDHPETARWEEPSRLLAQARAAL